MVGFIGAVNIDGYFVDRVQVQYRYAVSGQTVGTGLGAGNGAVNLSLDAGQMVDKVVGCRAGANANDGAGFHVIESRPGNHLFHFILCHNATPFICMARIIPSGVLDVIAGPPVRAGSGRGIWASSD